MLAAKHSRLSCLNEFGKGLLIVTCLLIYISLLFTAPFIGLLMVSDQLFPGSRFVMALLCLAGAMWLKVPSDPNDSEAMKRDDIVCNLGIKFMCAFLTITLLLNVGANLGRM